MTEKGDRPATGRWAASSLHARGCLRLMILFFLVTRFKRLPWSCAVGEKSCANATFCHSSACLVMGIRPSNGLIGSIITLPIFTD